MLSFKQIDTLRGAAGRHAAGVTRGTGRSAGCYVAGIALEVRGGGELLCGWGGATGGRGGQHA